MMDVGRLSLHLTQYVSKNPDGRLFGIPRGGLIVATYLAYLLGRKDVYSLRMKDLSVIGGELEKGDLIVDDIYDTGKTYEDIRKYCPDIGLVCLYVKHVPWPNHDPMFLDGYTFLNVVESNYVSLPWEEVVQSGKSRPETDESKGPNSDKPPGA